ncbi:MAG TPA: hypothetical protein VGT02_12060 [Methylomirabilota bacterium]|jgi:hypothetical protein|nr:hypothetical protein [Methylomirabilota bacterium]
MSRARLVRIAAALAAFAVALQPWPAAAQAPVNSGAMQPVPNGLNVSVLRPTAVNVVWTLRGGTPGARIQSPIGLFKERNVGGSQAGVGAGSCVTAPTAAAGETMGVIDSPVTTVVNPNGVARVVETLIIPGTVAERALKRGLDIFFYCREFTNAAGGAIVPGFPAVTNTVTCKQGSSAYANFSIARAELFFEDHRRTATVPLGSPDLKVMADVAYNGSGLMRAVWEVAELGATNLGNVPINAPPRVFDTPVAPNLLPQRNLFRTLHTITQYVGFGDRVLLTLPPSIPLPTTQPGTFVVNLRFVDPPVGFEIPVATYFVKSNEHPIKRAAINLLTPAEAQTLPYTLFGFRWESVPGASQYRLDVFPAETVVSQTFPGVIEGPRTNPSNDSNVFQRAPADLSGDREAILSALVPSAMTSFNLRQGHFTRLVAGRVYTWQVRALDQQGNIMGASPVRQFTLAPR